MAEYLCISATFLESRFHGRGDAGDPEWPPSPLRLMQALVAANADHIGVSGPLDQALAWLEQQSPPIIVAPRIRKGAAYCLSVPINAMDLVAKAWVRGNYFGTGDSNPATHRTMKTVRPIHLLGGETVHYLWLLKDSASTQLDTLIAAAKRLVALGWGIDMAVGSADRVTGSQVEELSGEWWQPTRSSAPAALRVPKQGTLQALQDRHHAFISRMGDDGFAPVEPLTRFDVIGYRRPTDPICGPFIVFALHHDDGSYCPYPQSKLIHISGMVRHLAKELMLKSPPVGVGNDWVERYIVGHRDEDASEHRQLSYLPLPSIGHPYADQAVRRVMITAPVGDDRWLEHMGHRLAGRQLVLEDGNEFGGQEPPTLVRVYQDKVARRYTDPASYWASVTPVILPGHDDRKPAKTRKLIEIALAQSGIEQPCEFEWSAYSRFRKSFSAHKYDKNKRPQGYIRPGYLNSQTAVHLTLRFKDDLNVPGPIAIGAGRHCGFGLLAPWS